jgi:hypothetical protein
MTKRQTIVAWGRPLGYETGLHALLSLNDRGSMVTACAGRWSAVEPAEVYYLPDASKARELAGAQVDICEACVSWWCAELSARLAKVAG